MEGKSYKRRERERFRSACLHKGLAPRYLQRLPLYGVAFPNPRPPGSRAGLKDKKKFKKKISNSSLKVLTQLQFVSNS